MRGFYSIGFGVYLLVSGFCFWSLQRGEALAWGASGHRLLTLAAMSGLPDDFPAFLKTTDALWDLGELAREPDRVKGSGNPHDHDLDAAHYINFNDSGGILQGPDLNPLPSTRADYEIYLQSLGTDSARSGWLPYAMAEAWQKIVKDFGYWRIDRLGAETAKLQEDGDWFARDFHLREHILLHDIGVFSHYVGDGSQPCHVSIHSNGWGHYPNQEIYTKERIHAAFEGTFVRNHVSQTDIQQAMTDIRVVNLPILTEIKRYLDETRSQIVPLFVLWTEGSFQDESPFRGKAFAAKRLGAGASELRDLLWMAWISSPSGVVGYPAVKVSDIESGKVPLSIKIFQGLD